MKLAAMQPTFMPWPGYFGLINFVDEFMFLNNVQFDKRSWQQRNLIIFNNKKNLLTVPVLTKNKFNQNINEVVIEKSSKYINKHLNTIKIAYAKTPFYKHYIDEISSIYNQNFNYLIDLNYSFIDFFLKKLKIKSKILFASNYNFNKKKDNLINVICKNRNCSQYISPQGSKGYLEKLIKEKKKYEIKFFGFNYENYNQTSQTFIKGASILDVLFNLGDKSHYYIKNNFFVK